jgi:hypothetical protein
MRQTIAESLMASFLIALGSALVAGVIAVSDSPIVIAHARHIPLRAGVAYQTEALISWPHVLITSAIGGIGTLLAIWGSVWLWHFVSYQLRGYKDDEWDAGEAWMQEGTASFLLKPKTAEPVASPTACRAKTAGRGTRVFSDGAIVRGAAYSRMINYSGASTGRYEIRWYGSTKRNKPYGITRAVFDLDDLNGGKYSAGGSRTGQNGGICRLLGCLPLLARSVDVSSGGLRSESSG